MNESCGYLYNEYMYKQNLYIVTETFYNVYNTPQPSIS